MAVERSARLMQGNEACVEGAIAAGCRFYAGYPITPSTEIAELMAATLPRVGGRFIQMEDEIASMAAVIGASLTGTKAMTATSGPGFSLKQENIGYASLTEVPCVIVNVQRSGPSTGLPTSPAQGDVMQSRWGTHGDHPIIVVSPSSVSETYRLTIQAFNLSEKYRNPVILLMDEVVGHMRERVDLHKLDTPIIDRVKPTCLREDYLPYDAPMNGVAPMADFGSGYRSHVTGLIHSKKGFPTSKAEEVDFLIRRLHNKISQNLDEILKYEEYMTDDAEILVLAFGSVARSAYNAVKTARQNGVKAGLFRPITIWPFPETAVAKLAEKVRHIIVPEMNLGQLRLEVERVACSRCQVSGINSIVGELIAPDHILRRIMEV
ncbi:MAG: 2-oxoacid:acceptor oxidoreductase subunit alpha [Bacillota bacterium]|jgi:2-oxoglutarate ferredoxin oxidoreductase subunit alpha